MKKISVAIATFNEESNIKECLEAVKPYADEIVVVDGSSSDKTAQIAREYTTKVIITQNLAMFHINKNLAIDNCQGNWILVLDADERVTHQLGREIRRTVKRWREGDPVGYYLNRKNLFLTCFLTKGGQYPDSVIRFFQKGKGRHPEVSVHEQIKIDGRVGFLKNDLIHLGSPNFNRYLARENRYSSIEASKMKKERLKINKFNSLRYLFCQPIATFFKIYFRHKGYQDGFPGFVFAFFSGLHFALAYIKYWEMEKKI